MYVFMRERNLNVITNCNLYIVDLYKTKQDHFLQSAPAIKMNDYIKNTYQKKCSSRVNHLMMFCTHSLKILFKKLSLWILVSYDKNQLYNLRMLTTPFTDTWPGCHVFMTYMSYDSYLKKQLNYYYQYTNTSHRITTLCLCVTYNIYIHMKIYLQNSILSAETALYM